jgi:hypothetical protein
MISRAAIFTVAAICLATLASLFAVENRDGKATPPLSRFRSANRFEREMMIDSLLKERGNAIQTLIDVVRATDREPKEFESLCQAMITLGSLRAEQAVEPLFERVAYAPYGLTRSLKADPLYYYPAAQALARIGIQPIDGVFQRFPRAMDDDELKVTAFVVFQIDGKKKEFGLNRLKLAVDRGWYTGVARQNLVRLHEVYKATDFSNADHWPGHPGREKGAGRG